MLGPCSWVNDHSIDLAAMTASRFQRRQIAGETTGAPEERITARNAAYGYRDLPVTRRQAGVKPCQAAGMGLHADRGCQLNLSSEAPSGDIIVEQMMRNATHPGIGDSFPIRKFAVDSSRWPSGYRHKKVRHRATPPLLGGGIVSSVLCSTSCRLRPCPAGLNVEGCRHFDQVSLDPARSAEDQPPIAKRFVDTRLAPPGQS